MKRILGVLLVLMMVTASVARALGAELPPPTPAVQVSSELYRVEGGVNIVLSISNVGKVPVSVVGATPCDPGIRTVVTAPDGKSVTLDGQPDKPLGNCALTVLEEHIIGPSKYFRVRYSYRYQGAPAVGSYRLAFEVPLAKYAQHPVPALDSAARSFLPFSDLADHWLGRDIDTPVSQGWVQGYPDGSFRPNQDVTVAELLAMLAKARGLEPVPVTGDADWAAPWLAAARRAGWWDGGGHIPMLRADAQLLLARSWAMDAKPPVSLQEEVDLQWAIGVSRLIFYQGVLKPSLGNLTRAEAVSWISHSVKVHTPVLEPQAIVTLFDSLIPAKVMAASPPLPELVELAPVADMADIPVTDGGDGTYQLTRRGLTLQVIPDAAITSAPEVKLGRPVERVEGNLYVPLSVLEYFGLMVRVSHP